MNEELLTKANNKFFTPNEFNHALKDSLNREYALYMHLNISSLSYHHQELYSLLSSMNTKPKMIGISDSRLQISKQPINIISLPNYVYEHTPTESGKGGTLLYIDQNLKYKVRRDLNIYSKSLIESTSIEIMNTKQKNMIIGCIYKHPRQETHDFNENYILSLMYKLSREKKDILNIGDFNINLLNYNNGKDTTTFLDTIFSNSFLPFINFSYQGLKHFRNSNG